MKGVFLMKKIIIFGCYVLFFVISLNMNNISADSKATSMGFTVDNATYGSYLDYDIDTVNVYHNSTIIGYAELETAVYRDQTDSNYGLVINYVTAEPKPTSNWFYKFDSQTSSITITSDVDGSSEVYGYGYYASSANFEMKQPQPQPVADVSSYKVGLSYNGTWTVEGEVEVEESELEVFTSHSSSNDIFSANYRYYCIGAYTDCSYRKAETYQKGMYLIDWTASPPTTYKRFINETNMSVIFADGSGNPLTIFWQYSAQLGQAYNKLTF